MLNYNLEFQPLGRSETDSTMHLRIQQNPVYTLVYQIFCFLLSPTQFFMPL